MSLSPTASPKKKSRNVQVNVSRSLPKQDVINLCSTSSSDEAIASPKKKSRNAQVKFTRSLPKQDVINLCSTSSIDEESPVLPAKKKHNDYLSDSVEISFANDSVELCAKQDDCAGKKEPTTTFQRDKTQPAVLDAVDSYDSFFSVEAGPKPVIRAGDIIAYRDPVGTMRQ